jgi:hypothetical protein
VRIHTSWRRCTYLANGQVCNDLHLSRGSRSSRGPLGHVSRPWPPSFGCVILQLAKILPNKNKIFKTHMKRGAPSTFKFRMFRTSKFLF